MPLAETLRRRVCAGEVSRPASWRLCRQRLAAKIIADFLYPALQADLGMGVPNKLLESCPRARQSVLDGCKLLVRCSVEIFRDHQTCESQCAVDDSRHPESFSFVFLLQGLINYPDALRHQNDVHVTPLDLEKIAARKHWAAGAAQKTY